MTTSAPSILASNIYATLGSFLLSILPSGVTVAKGLVNRVPEMPNADFVLMTGLRRVRIETNTVIYSDGYPSNPTTRTDLTPTEVVIQLDVHGPNSEDNVQVIENLFRSEYAVEQFATYGFDLTPLYSTDPIQAPFLNGEQQIEFRWITEAHMQANISVTNSQQFADEIEVGIISVEASYPPHN